MGLIVSNTDFVGNWQISGNTFTVTNLDTCIADNEKNFLYDLLGKTLADLFIADLLNHVPQTAIYQKLYEPLWEKINGCRLRTDGMKNMMLGLIYFEFMRKDPINSTITGPQRNSNENSDSMDGNIGIINRYNKAVEDYKTIQEYCCANKTIYPDFEGARKGIALPF